MKVEIIATTNIDTERLEQLINDFLSELETGKVINVKIVNESLAYITYYI